MKKNLLTLTFVLLSTVILAQVSEQEKQVLLDLYLSTNGENWINTWDTNAPVTQWHGVTVENDKVVSISLLFNNMDGEIPSSLGDLEDLRNLELSFNKLSGSLPESLGSLKNLEVFAFNGNDLTGSIPVSLGNLKKLKQLHISSNKLTGTIPYGLGDLKSLEVFNVFDNDLVGELPVGLASNQSLRELMVAENDLVTTQEYSKALLANSGLKFDVNKRLLANPNTKSIIAIESSEDEN